MALTVIKANGLFLKLAGQLRKPASSASRPAAIKTGIFLSDFELVKLISVFAPVRYRGHNPYSRNNRYNRISPLGR